MGKYDWYVKIPQYGYMEHELKILRFIFHLMLWTFDNL